MTAYLSGQLSRILSGVNCREVAHDLMSAGYLSKPSIELDPNHIKIFFEYSDSILLEIVAIAAHKNVSVLIDC